MVIVIAEKEIKTSADLSHLFLILRERDSIGNGIIHRHPFWELILFEKGQGTHTINGVNYTFKPHDLALLAPSDIHQIASDEGTTFDCTKVCFPHSIYGDQLKNLCRFDRFPVIVTLDATDYGKATLLLGLLEEEFATANLPGSDLFSINLLEQLFVLIVRNLDTKTNIQSAGANNISNILMYIQSHFTEQITIEEVASLSNYSAKYFGRLFLRQIGIPFQDYLKSLRLNYAYHLIAYTERPIIDICYEAGFTSPTYFSKSFKRKYGLSPSQLRQSETDK